MTIAWVFPGQGSQKIGMADLIIGLPGAKERFAFASELLGRDLLKICSGQVEAGETINNLNDTRNTQPAMFIVESLLVDDLCKQGRKAAFFAGHSLGEIVALYAARVLDVETGLRLLKCRSELMASAANGSMIAVLGFDRKQLEDLVNAKDGVVIANDNSSSQVVLSGITESVESVAKELKCKRSIPLQVSGAFHSPLMEEASTAFIKELDKVTFNDAISPVISNADPKPTTNGSLLKEKLKKQMTTGVRWRETMETLVAEGVQTVVEIGPGNVLGGLAKRSMKGIAITQIASESDLGH